MKYNPITKKLFTSDDLFIKKLHCPYGVNWSDLIHTENKHSRQCDICEKNIIDTKSFSEEEIIKLIHQGSAVCLKIDLNQDNIRVVNCEV